MKSSNLGLSSFFIWPQQLTLKRKKNNNSPPNPPKIQLRVNSEAKWNLALLEILAWIKIPQKSSWLINLSALSTNTCMKKPWCLYTMNVCLVRSNETVTVGQWMELESTMSSNRNPTQDNAALRLLGPLSFPVLWRMCNRKWVYLQFAQMGVCVSNVLPPGLQPSYSFYKATSQRLEHMWFSCEKLTSSFLGKRGFGSRWPPY